MSRETRTNFSRKKKMNGTQVAFVLPKETQELVNQIYKKFGARNKEKANTVRILMYVALNNNFDSDLNYIPCKSRRNPPQMVANKKDGKSEKFVIYCSPEKLLPKIDKLVAKNGSNRSATMRMLVCVALQYNYDEELNYKPAERVSYEQNTSQYSNDVVIFLDEI